MDDINDTDLVSLLLCNLQTPDGSASRTYSHSASSAAETAVGPVAENQNGSGPLQSSLGRWASDSLLIFCNNVAFNEGTIHR